MPSDRPRRDELSRSRSRRAALLAIVATIAVVAVGVIVVRP
jgi:hypothetical protein